MTRVSNTYFEKVLEIILTFFIFLKTRVKTVELLLIFKIIKRKFVIILKHEDDKIRISVLSRREFVDAPMIHPNLSRFPDYWNIM